MPGQYVFLEDGKCPHCGCEWWNDGDESYGDTDR